MGKDRNLLEMIGSLQGAAKMFLHKSLCVGSLDTNHTLTFVTFTLFQHVCK